MSIKANKTDKQNVVYNHIKRVIYNYQKCDKQEKSTVRLTKVHGILLAAERIDWNMASRSQF